MNISEIESKLTLANDMIYYLIQVLLNNTNNTNKTEAISQILSKWDARISAGIRKIRYDQAKLLAKESNIEIDVASILISIQQTELIILKKEFKENIEKDIINAIIKKDIK